MASSFHLLNKPLADGLVTHSILEQFYNLVPGVFYTPFSLAQQLKGQISILRMGF